jgi:hypothetical protein
MPLPTPKSNESRSEFVSRCMGDQEIRSKFGSRDQRLAVCISQFGKTEGSEDERPAFDWSVQALRDLLLGYGKGSTRKRKKRT